MCDQQNIFKSEKTESKMEVLKNATSCVDRPLVSYLVFYLVKLLTSALQLDLIELCELSEDVFLFIFGQTHSIVSHLHT